MFAPVDDYVPITWMKMEESTYNNNRDGVSTWKILRENIRPEIPDCSNLLNKQMQMIHMESLVYLPTIIKNSK